MEWQEVFTRDFRGRVQVLAGPVHMRFPASLLPFCNSWGSQQSASSMAQPGINSSMILASRNPFLGVRNDGTEQGLERRWKTYNQWEITNYFVQVQHVSLRKRKIFARTGVGAGSPPDSANNLMRLLTKSPNRSILSPRWLLSQTNPAVLPEFSSLCLIT